MLCIYMQGDAKAAEKFQEVGKAYDTLRDSQKRAIYDQVGKLPNPCVGSWDRIAITLAQVVTSRGSERFAKLPFLLFHQIARTESEVHF